MSVLSQIRFIAIPTALLKKVVLSTAVVPFKHLFALVMHAKLHSWLHPSE